MSPKTTVLAASTVEAAPKPGVAGVLRYAGGNGVHVGQIVAIGPGPATPAGFLGRVLGVRANGAGTVVSTTPVTLEQAVHVGSFDETFGSTGAAERHATRRALARALNKAVKCTGSASASLSPTMSLGAQFEAKANWSWNPFDFGLRSASLTAQAHADGGVTATVEGAGSCTLDPITFAKFRGPSISFFVGPVPVVITSEISVDVEASVQAQAALTTGIGLSFDAQAGVGWTKKGGFYPIDSFDQKFTHTLSVDASASVEADVIPKIDVFLYGVAGPEIALKGGLNLTADINQDPWWTLTAPVDLSASLELPALHLSSPTLDVYQHTFVLAKADGPFGGDATVSVTNPGDQNGTVDSPVDLQIQASDSADRALTYGATGLPSGLSIDPSSGLISGTPSSATATSVTVTATDTFGAHGSASFAWTVVAPSSSYTPGELMVSIGNGLVDEFAPDGTLIRTLDTGTGSEYTTGSAFDAAGNFYVTDFATGDVTKFDQSGEPVGSFGSGYNSSPESITFDANGNAYVGQADDSTNVLEFDPAGNPLASFTPDPENRGTDWIALGPDNCTLYYTSEGTSVKRFDVCTNQPLADFADNLPGSYAFEIRLLPDGGMLVADSESIVRLDASGNVIQQYTDASDANWFSLDLTPDGTALWGGDDSSGDIVEWDLGSGDELATFNAQPAVEVDGLTVVGAARPVFLQSFSGTALREDEVRDLARDSVAYGHPMGRAGAGKTVNAGWSRCARGDRVGVDFAGVCPLFGLGRAPPPSLGP